MQVLHSHEPQYEKTRLRKDTGSQQLRLGNILLTDYTEAWTCLVGKGDGDEIKHNTSGLGGSGQVGGKLNNGRECGAATDYKRSAKATNPPNEVHLMYY